MKTVRHFVTKVRRRNRRFWRLRPRSRKLWKRRSKARSRRMRARKLFQKQAKSNSVVLMQNKRTKARIISRLKKIIRHSVNKKALLMRKYELRIWSIVRFPFSLQDLSTNKLIQKNRRNTKLINPRVNYTFKKKKPLPLKYQYKLKNLLRRILMKKSKNNSTPHAFNSLMISSRWNIAPYNYIQKRHYSTTEEEDARLKNYYSRMQEACELIEAAFSLTMGHNHRNFPNIQTFYKIRVLFSERLLRSVVTATCDSVTFDKMLVDIEKASRVNINFELYILVLKNIKNYKKTGIHYCELWYLVCDMVYDKKIKPLNLQESFDWDYIKAMIDQEAASVLTLMIQNAENYVANNK